jgi:hypothetical protein
VQGRRCQLPSRGHCLGVGDEDDSRLGSWRREDDSGQLWRPETRTTDRRAPAPGDLHRSAPEAWLLAARSEHSSWL